MMRSRVIVRVYLLIFLLLLILLHFRIDVSGSVILESIEFLNYEIDSSNIFSAD